MLLILNALTLFILFQGLSHMSKLCGVTVFATDTKYGVDVLPTRQLIDDGPILDNIRFLVPEGDNIWKIMSDDDKWKNNGNHGYDFESAIDGIIGALTNKAGDKLVARSSDKSIENFCNIQKCIRT
jgi:hypothetical protein